MTIPILIKIRPSHFGTLLPGTANVPLTAAIERENGALTTCRITGLATPATRNTVTWIYNPSNPNLPDNLVLRPAGTAFQRAVWAALSTIEPGQTRSYSELAAAIGHPRAVRAVANACGANPIALWIPCHRVCRRDGELGGYRWGTAIKRLLLAAEGSQPGYR